VAGGAAGFWGNSIQWPIPYWLMVGGGIWWLLGLPLPVLGLLVATLSAVAAIATRFRNQPLSTWPIPLNSLVLGAATTTDTIPRLVLVVALAAGTGITMWGLLLLLSLTSWPHPARLVRAQMLRTRALPFVEAAGVAGLPAGRVWLRHALPHAMLPLRTAFPLSIAGLLGLESTLSFLGIGLPPDVASWGRLLGAVREEPTAWWTFVFPGICLTFTLLSLNTISSSHHRTAELIS
jgi:peptide/nickel transport system permease protein